MPQGTGSFELGDLEKPLGQIMKSTGLVMNFPAFVLPLFECVCEANA